MYIISILFLFYTEYLLYLEEILHIKYRNASHVFKADTSWRNFRTKHRIASFSNIIIVRSFRVG